MGLYRALSSSRHNRFKQLAGALLCFRVYLHELRIAAPFRGHEAGFRELPFHALQVGFRVGCCVDWREDGHLGGSGMVDRFFGLRHDSVIGGHNQHHDIGNLCAPGAHARERFVTRRIHEHHGAVIDDHLVSADVLRNAARFARGNIRFADRVEQTRFAVIDVAHHRHHRRPWFQAFPGLFLRYLKYHLLFERHDAYYSAERFGKSRCRRHIQRLVDAGEDAAVEQVFQDVLGAHIQLFGKFANRDAFRNRHIARRTRLRRRDNRSGRAAARARTMPSRMQFAFPLLLALICNGALALPRLARVERLARLRLWPHLLRKWRQHSPPPGHTRGGTRAWWHRAATLLRRPGLSSTRTAATRSEWPSLAGLLWTHGLPGTRAARPRFPSCIRNGATIPRSQRTAISRGQWPSRSACSRG